MNEYEQKGYSFISKKDYLMLEKVYLDYCDKRYYFGLQVNQDEFYFYIINNNSNIYLSIYDIYCLLYEIVCKNSNTEFLNLIKRQMNMSTRLTQEVWYKNLYYSIHKIVRIKKDGCVISPESGVSITYSQLFLLINLIQAKSNALFEKSTQQNRKYKNGILRLFTALLSTTSNNDILKSIGWVYKDGKFILDRIENETERSKQKYYLTKEELKTILG